MRVAASITVKSEFTPITACPRGCVAAHRLSYIDRAKRLFGSDQKAEMGAAVGTHA